MSEPINFDPNMTLSGNRAKSTIRFVFGQWDYRCERTVEFKSNMTGLSAASWALETLVEQLHDECNGLPALSMFNKSGDELICEDDEGRWDEWLKDMLISFEIIGFEPAGKVGGPV